MLTRIKLLQPTDTLTLGHAYRLITNQGILTSLELERSHSKLFKDDSLSVYEATLMKLKRGSQLATTYSFHPPIEDPMESETDCISTISSTILHNSDNFTHAVDAAAANCSLSSISSASSISPSVADLKPRITSGRSICGDRRRIRTSAGGAALSERGSQSSGGATMEDFEG
ncbi:hypothetical protein LINPERPRIM_LOCUS33151 [Linum perenne]